MAAPWHGALQEPLGGKRPPAPNNLGLPWNGLGQPNHTGNPAPATALRTAPRSHPDLRVGQSVTRLVGIRITGATASGGWQPCQDKKGLPAPLQLQALLEQCLRRSAQKGPPESSQEQGAHPSITTRPLMLSPSFKSQWFEHTTRGPVAAPHCFTNTSTTLGRRREPPRAAAGHNQRRGLEGCAAASSSRRGARCAQVSIPGHAGAPCRSYGAETESLPISV